MKDGKTLILRILVLVVCFFRLPNFAVAAVPVALFPLQDLSDERKGRNDANLPFTRILAERLMEIGNQIVAIDTVITFMADNRIRKVGSLESFYFPRVRFDLGAPFVLLGTITQRKELPVASLGLTLYLVRTSDARTLWYYIGEFSTASERRALGINEPQSTEDLQLLLLDEVAAQWPWEIIKEPQQAEPLRIESSSLYPNYVRTGDEIYTQVRLRDIGQSRQAPRVFFKALDQLYPAMLSPDGFTYKGSWFAGEETGQTPVTVLLDWTNYDRREEILLGSYFVDNTPPLFEIEFKGTTDDEGIPVFRRVLEIIPHPLIRKPVARWRLAFYDDTHMVGEMLGTGDLPPRFFWKGRGTNVNVLPDGVYQVVIEAWDRAGNLAKDAKMVEKDISVSELNLAADRSEDGIVVDLSLTGTVPLAFWRLELWTKEGRLLTQSQGKDLPVQIDLDIPDSAQEQDIEGFLFYQDIWGEQVRRKITDIFPEEKKEVIEKKKKPSGISKEWVEEF